MRFSRRLLFISGSWFPDFLPVPFWKHPRSARSQLTKTSKRLRGEKGPRFPFINSSSDSLSLFLPLGSLPPSCPFPFCPSSFASALFRNGSLRFPLVGSAFSPGLDRHQLRGSMLTPRFCLILNANCFANIIFTQLGGCRECRRRSGSAKAVCLGAGVLP